LAGVKLILVKYGQEKFGQRVKELERIEVQKTIEQLANISNVDRNYISDIEKG
jgi:transcriptional regulator with XRE-family HTH domain